MYTLHVIYVVIFAAVYSIFTGIYFAGSDGGIVYNVLDYEQNVALAVGLIFLTVFIIIPAVHFIIFYPLSKLKEVVLYCIFKDRGHTMMDEGNSMEEIGNKV